MVSNQPKYPPRNMPLPGKWGIIYGGPFKQQPPDHFRVKMAKELKMGCEVNIPTEDFGVPPYDLLLSGLQDTVKALFDGEAVYVGCMGGIGRTGLFLACLIKAFGIKTPINYVREHYNPKAVETAEQRWYVQDFDITQVASLISKYDRLRKVRDLKFVGPWACKILRYYMGI